MSYGQRGPEMFRFAATYVDKIFKGGKARRFASDALDETLSIGEYKDGCDAQDSVGTIVSLAGQRYGEVEDESIVTSDAA